MTILNFEANKKPRYGCHNRKPLAAAYPKSNGQMLENAFWAKPCEYTKSELGQADPKCQGCKWKGEK